MTEIAQAVFAQHQVRKSKKQKTKFIQFVTETAAREGYACKTEKGSLGARNIVIGDPDRAKVIYTAHYDTCPRLPFPNFITPKNFFVYLLYQIAIVILGFFLPIAILETGTLHLASALSWSGAWLDYTINAWSLLWCVFFIWLLMAGPANKHTANDNTSGVITLLELMSALPSESRAGVAFVFFDMEETGLFGSSGFASKHKQVVKNTLLINFDCVSDGDTILFAVRKGARAHEPLLQKVFAPADGFSVDVCSKGVFYPSDQANFKLGVGVAALKRTKGGKLLYMDRIHTKHDTVFCEKNISFLVDGAVRFAAEVQQTEATA